MVDAGSSPVVGGPATARDTVFSNIGLRGIGFTFRYPRVEEGLRQVLGELHE